MNCGQKQSWQSEPPPPPFQKFLDPPTIYLSYLHCDIIISVISSPVIHSVQRLITSEGAKGRILDDITVIVKYFWQIIIAWSEDIIKDDTELVYYICFQNFQFPQTLRYSFDRGNSFSEILQRSFCDAETFNDQTLYTWIILIHVSSPCDINNIAKLLWYGKIFIFLQLHVERGVVQCVIYHSLSRLLVVFVYYVDFW